MDANTILTFRQTMGFFSDFRPDPKSILEISGTLETLSSFIKGRTGQIIRVEEDSCGCCSTTTIVAKVENGEICFEPVSSWDTTSLEELAQSF